MHLRHNLKTRPRLALIALLLLLGLVSLANLPARISEAMSFVAPTPSSSPRSEASFKDKQIESVPGEILVRFRSDAAAARATNKGGDFAQFVAAEDGRQVRLQIEGVAQGSELVEGLRMARVEPAETDDALTALRSRPDVIYAEPNYVRRRLTTANDSNFTAQWSLKNTGQSGGTAGADIHAEAAWDVTTGSRNVVVG